MRAQTFPGLLVRTTEVAIGWMQREIYSQGISFQTLLCQLRRAWSKEHTYHIEGWLRPPNPNFRVTMFKCQLFSNSVFLKCVYVEAAGEANCSDSGCPLERLGLSSSFLASGEPRPHDCRHLGREAVQEDFLTFHKPNK